MSGKQTKTATLTKYPLDSKALSDIAVDLLQNDLAQRDIIDQLAGFLQQSLEAADCEWDWEDDANTLLKNLDRRRRDFETHRFNQKNGHQVKMNSPYPDLSRISDPETEQRLNEIEASFGEEMSEEDVAKIFSEPKPKKKKEKKFSKMTLEEIQAWEKAQDNSNDIYKVSARVKNLARQGAGANLTTAGDILCNSYTHVLKSLYDFADTVEDKDTKIKLVELVRSNEGMAASIVSALGAGVNMKR